MKRKLTNLSAILAMAIIANGCADDTFDSIKGNDVEREVTLNLRLPAFATPTTRGANADLIENLRIYFLNSGNAEIGLPQDIYSVPEDNKVTVVMPAGTESIKVIANYPGEGQEEDFIVRYSDVNPNSESATSLIFYGATSKGDLSTDDPKINLYRSCAKTYFNTEDGVNVSEYRFYGNPDKGSIIYSQLTEPTLPIEGVTYSDVGIIHAASEENPFYHYEAERGNCFWVIKAEYEGIDYYYKIGYLLGSDESADSKINRPEGSKGDEVDIIRNNSYVFTIKNINAPGYTSPSLAAAADVYENRIEVEMKNYSESIFDMIACRDYYLGVQDKVSCDAVVTDPFDSGVYAKFEVITNYKGNFTISNIKIIEGEDFVDDSRVGGILVSSSHSDIGESDGSQYTVQIPMFENSYSNDERVVKVRVTVGDLYRDILITQNGMDFLDPANGIISVGIVTDGVNPASGRLLNASEFGQLPIAVTGTPYDYLTFLRKDLKGATEEDMGLRRDNGLHFQIFAEEGKQYEYFIDLGTSVTDASVNIKYQQEADKELYTAAVVNGQTYNSYTHKYVSVKLTAKGNENYKIWTSEFQVTVGGRNIVYEVYHTGVIHNLDGSRQLADSDGSKAIGWFYYEQVDVKGEDGYTYHILDRNLGASSNKSYVEGGAFSSQNTSSRGGYFILPQTTDGSSPLAEAGFLPVGFDMPEVYHISSPDDNHLTLTNMGMRVEGGVPTWRSTGSSKIARTYIPIAGYMEGANLMNPTHAQIWSCDILKGNQGFSEESTEFGNWFRYLDVSGQLSSVQNTRIANRGTGADIAMGVRLMKGPSAPAGWALPNMASNRARLILYNEAGWSEVVAYCTGGNEKDYVIGLKKGDSAGSWYYIDLPYVPDYVQFSNENNKGTQKQAVNVGVNEYHNDKAGEFSPDFVTIYCQNNADWDALYIHYWNNTDNPYTDWSRSPQMVKVTYDGARNWWRYYVPVNTKGVVIKSIPNGADEDKRIDREIQEDIEQGYRIFELKNNDSQFITKKKRDGSAGTGGDSSNDSYAIRGVYNNHSWSQENNLETNAFILTYNSGSGKYEGTLTVSTLEGNTSFMGQFMIIKKTGNDNWKEWGWAGTGSNSLSIVSGTTYNVADASSSKGNWVFPAPTTYNFSLDPGSRKLTVTFNTSGGGGGGEGYDPPAGKVRIVVYKDDEWTGDVKIEYGWQNDSNGQSGRPNVGMNYGGTTTDGIEWYYVDAEPGIYELKLHNGSDYSREWIKFETKVTSGTIYISIHSNDKTSKKLAPRRKSASRRAITRR